MKRFSLLSFTVATATLTAPTVALADPWPALIYVPTEDLTLTPSAEGVCAGISMSAQVAGRGCYPFIDTETTEPAYADAEALAEGLATALAPYDVHVTTTRPPEYQPYFILLASDEPVEKSNSFTCTAGDGTCSSRQRDGFGFTNGGTLQCTEPDQLAAALYVFGRLSGLEGKVANVPDPKDPKAPVLPPDPMDYPPDFTTPATAFQDRCDPLAHQLVIDPKAKEPTPEEQPFECTSEDHTGCKEAEQQNSHVDLLAYYGEFHDDVDPPAFENLVPEDGAVLESGATLSLDVDVVDSDSHVALRWTVESAVFEGIDIPELADGSLSACTSPFCDVNYLDGSPFKATDSDWAQSYNALPPGEYTITLEAADYHGNVAEPVIITVTIAGDEGEDEESGGGSTTGGEDDGVFTTGLEESSSEESGGAPEESEDESGCACSQSQGRGQGNLLLLFGALGLVGYRGRRASSRARR